METAEAEYTHLFGSMPKFYFTRYRYALMLSGHEVGLHRLAKTDCKKWICIRNLIG